MYIKLGVVNETLTEDNITSNNVLKKNYELSILSFGNVDFENKNIYLSSIILGLIDGLDPSMICVFIILLALLLDDKNKKNKIILSVILLFSLNASYIIFINNGGFDNAINYASLARLLLSVILICFGTAKLIIYANELDEKKKN